MKRFASLLFVGTAVFAASCAHAAPVASICPVKTLAAVVFQKSSMPGLNIEEPPQTAANGEPGAQTWDISRGKGTFYIECHANTQGKDGITVIEVPTGTKTISFTPATGVAYN